MQRGGISVAVKKLWVKMFGGFSASYGDEVLTFGKQRDSKFGQLFQILMTRPGQGFSKGDIAESLYGREQVENPNGSLNNTIFRLRKYLKESPLPPGDYLQLDGGILRFAGGMETMSDVWDFEQGAQAFEMEKDRRKKAALCKKACEYFRGEFLPQLSNEQWVIEKNRNYQKMYAGMMEYLLCYWKEEGDYGSMEKAAARASRLCPGEGWELWQVDSMISMGRYEEAEQVYQEMALRLQENGGFLRERQQAHFRETGARLRHPEGNVEEISKYLAEPELAEGAYACMLPGFSDCFRMLGRIIARGGVSGFIIMLCTILDGKGNPAKDQVYCEKQGEKLLASFRCCLRKGDIYAKYSDGQYLVMCAGAARENVPDIGARLDKDFRKCRGGRGGISCIFLDGRAARQGHIGQN